MGQAIAAPSGLEACRIVQFRAADGRDKKIVAAGVGQTVVEQSRHKGSDWCVLNPSAVDGWNNPAFRAAEDIANIHAGLVYSVAVATPSRAVNGVTAMHLPPAAITEAGTDAGRFRSNSNRLWPRISRSLTSRAVQMTEAWAPA